MPVKALQARADWSDILMRVANGTSPGTIAREINVHPQSLQRALEAEERKRIAREAAPIKEQAAKAQEVVQEATGVVEGGQLMLPMGNRSPIEAALTLQGIIDMMRDEQQRLAFIADTHQKDSPMIAIAASKATLDALGVILTVMMKYKIHSEKDITNHEGFNRLVTVILEALAPYPEAAAAVLAAIEGMNN